MTCLGTSLNKRNIRLSYIHLLILTVGHTLPLNVTRTWDVAIFIQTSYGSHSLILTPTPLVSKHRAFGIRMDCRFTVVLGFTGT